MTKQVVLILYSVRSAGAWCQTTGQGRLYRDLLGKVNRELAWHTDIVYFMVAGTPVGSQRIPPGASVKRHRHVRAIPLPVMILMACLIAAAVLSSAPMFPVLSAMTISL